VTVKYAAQIDAMYADANEKAGKGAARAPSP
jgi:hypothetical protein